MKVVLSSTCSCNKAKISRNGSHNEEKVVASSGDGKKADSSHDDKVVASSGGGEKSG
jgi:hypothetical protein